MPKIKVARWKLMPGQQGERIIIQDTKGRLWERSEEWPVGRWGAIELPDEPNVVQDSRKRRATKR